MITHNRRRLIATGLLIAFLATGGALEAQRREPRDIRGARRPHAELPLGKTNHAARVVDDYFDAYWQGLGVTPAPRVDDATFLRRVSLVLHGVPASAGEVARFLEDKAPDKRAALVDSLLVQSRYADYWGFRLRSWITEMREALGQSTNLTTLYFYTREVMAENRAWSRIAKDLVAEEGEVTHRGYANFALYFDCEANEVAEAASRLFLGVDLSCAQCHDHPHVDEFTQESYWGLAAYFAKIYIGYGKPTYVARFPSVPRNPKGISTLPGGDVSVDGVWGDERGVLEDPGREVKLPDPKNPKTMKPAPLGGAPIENVDAQETTRRHQMVAWMTSDDNPYFARAAVNRFWMELTGLGFVDALDGFTPKPSARHAELLDELARQFNANGHDIKWLLRTIVLSRVFQNEHRVDPKARDLWTSLFPRPLNADQWHDSVLRATGEEERIFDCAEEIAVLLEEEHHRRILVNENPALLATVIRRETASKKEKASDDSKSDESPATGIDDDVSAERKKLEELRKKYDDIGLRLRKTRDDLRAEISPTNEALLMMNGELVATSLRDGLAPPQIAKLPTPEDRLDRLYLSVLGRLPVESERNRLLREVREPSQEKVKDLMWALLQSTEFLTY